MNSSVVPQLNVRRAFVIDDDIAVQQFVTTTLLAHGFSIEGFTTAGPALAALGNEHPVIIFLDVALLNSDAIDVLVGLGRLNYCGVVHLMSAGRRQLVEAVQRLGVRHGVNLAEPLGKPVEHRAILDAIANLTPAAAAAKA